MSLPKPGLVLRPITADVYSVHQTDGQHVGNLKRIGAVWKFKAVGYDATGGVEPGHGPFTLQHNTVLTTPDATALNVVFSAAKRQPGLS